MQSKLVLALTLLTLPLAAAVANDAEERKAVLAVIDAFFVGMTAKDIDSMRKIMTDDGVLYGYRETSEGLSVFNPTHANYLESLAARESVPVERYWEPTIMLHDRLATVWTPYDFYSDGVFSHCGVNNFSMLKTDDGWKIAGIVFSMEPDGCEPSPLGPLQTE
ncbi:MAG: nuclear transport factor 2 family protein [Woeseiaceae bacterium]